MKKTKYLILLAAIMMFVVSTPIFALDENETEKLPIDPEQTTILYGDVNGDEEVDSRDFALLKQYLLGEKSIDDISLENSDCNQDDEVDSRDFTLLKRYLLGEISLNS